MNSTDLLQLVDNLQQAGKMHAQHAASLWRFWLFYCAVFRTAFAQLMEISIKTTFTLEGEVSINCIY